MYRVRDNTMGVEGLPGRYRWRSVPVILLVLEPNPPAKKIQPKARNLFLGFSLLLRQFLRVEFKTLWIRKQVVVHAVRLDWCCREIITISGYRITTQSGLLWVLNSWNWHLEGLTYASSMCTLWHQTWVLICISEQQIAKGVVIILTGELCLMSICLRSWVQCFFAAIMVSHPWAQVRFSNTDDYLLINLQAILAWQGRGRETHTFWSLWISGECFPQTMASHCIGVVTTQHISCSRIFRYIAFVMNMNHSIPLLCVYAPPEQIYDSLNLRCQSARICQHFSLSLLQSISSYEVCKMSGRVLSSQCQLKVTASY